MDDTPLVALSSHVSRTLLRAHRKGGIAMKRWTLLAIAMLTLFVVACGSDAVDGSERRRFGLCCIKGQ